MYQLLYHELITSVILLSTSHIAILWFTWKCHIIFFISTIFQGVVHSFHYLKLNFTFIPDISCPQYTFFIVGCSDSPIRIINFLMASVFENIHLEKISVIFPKKIFALCKEQKMLKVSIGLMRHKNGLQSTCKSLNVFLRDVKDLIHQRGTC